MGTSTRTFTFWRDHNDLVKPITKDCNIVTIPFRSNLGPEIITKVMNTDKFEILGIEEDGTNLNMLQVAYASVVHNGLSDYVVIADLNIDDISTLSSEAQSLSNLVLISLTVRPGGILISTFVFADVAI